MQKFAFSASLGVQQRKTSRTSCMFIMFFGGQMMMAGRATMFSAIMVENCDICLVVELFSVHPPVDGEHDVLKDLLRESHRPN